MGPSHCLRTGALHDLFCINITQFFVAVGLSFCYSYTYETGYFHCTDVAAFYGIR